MKVELAVKKRAKAMCLSFCSKRIYKHKKEIVR